MRTNFGILYLGLLTLALAINTTQAAVVLQYHHVSDATPASTSVTPERFKAHMDYLDAKGFRVVPVMALIEKLKKGEPLPDKTVAITFDDAYDNVYTTAYPLLKARNWPFTVFVNTDPHDQKKSGFATWAQLREMAESGASIANHSTAHNHLLRLKEGETRAQWRKRISAEILDAEARIKAETGQSHRLLAYPYGEYDKALQVLVESLGFVAFGQQSGPLREGDDLRALPRFPFGGSYGEAEDFATKVNTRPMPIAELAFYADMQKKQALADLVLPPAQRPVLALQLSEEKVAARVNCFASGQGAIDVKRQGTELLVRANQPLRPGRGRYNCTAATGEPGRFYWFTQQWLTTGEQGRWLHND